MYRIGTGLNPVLSVGVGDVESVGSTAAVNSEESLILTPCPGLGQASTCGTTAVTQAEPANPVVQFGRTSACRYPSGDSLGVAVSRLETDQQNACLLWLLGRALHLQSTTLFLRLIFGLTTLFL